MVKKEDAKAAVRSKRAAAASSNRKKKPNAKTAALAPYVGAIVAVIAAYIFVPLALSVRMGNGEA